MRYDVHLPAVETAPVAQTCYFLLQNSHAFVSVTVISIQYLQYRERTGWNAFRLDGMLSIQSSLNLCTGRPPIGVMIPEAV